MKINLVSFNPLAADTAGNTQQITAVLRASSQETELVVFPEAALCGCPLFDLFDDKRLHAQNAAALKEIAKETKKTACVLGYADRQGGQSVTAVAFIHKGKIVKIFDTETVSLNGKNLQITLDDPQTAQADPDADAVIFILARPYIKGNVAPRLDALKKFAKKNCVPALLCNLLGGGDGMIFDGQTALANPKGALTFCGKLFAEGVHAVDLEEKRPSVSYQTPVLQELWDALTFALRDYVHKSGAKQVRFGGGNANAAVLDALADRALGEENVCEVAFSKDGAVKKENHALLLSSASKSECALGLNEIGEELLPLGDLYQTEVYELAEFLNKGGVKIPSALIKNAQTAGLTDKNLPSCVLDKILRAYLEDGLPLDEIVKKIRVKKDAAARALEQVNRADLKRRQSAPVLQVSPHPLSASLRPIIKKINL